MGGTELAELLEVTGVCGRYATTKVNDDLRDQYGIDERHVDEPLEPDYNVAPTKLSAVVLSRPPREDRDAAPVRQLRNLKWGLVPSWSRDLKIGSKLINARAETVDSKPSFRKAFARQRGLLPIDGFYEWFPTQEIGKSGKPLKQPFYLHRKDSGPLSLAVIYDFWRDEEKADDDPARWLTTFSIVTTTATDQVGHLHDRMPMTVPDEHWDDWLVAATNPAGAKSLMAPPPDGSLEIYAVAKDVNSVRNNGPELIKPLPDAE